MISLGVHLIDHFRALEVCDRKVDTFADAEEFTLADEEKEEHACKDQ